DRLAILVLDARERRPLERGDVELLLPRRVRVVPSLDGARELGELLGRRVASYAIGYQAKVLAREHPALREGELEHRIVGYPRPVDELVAHVWVHAEREDGRDDLHREAVIGGELRDLRDGVEVAASIRAEAG